jgi:PAS domain S-box-containing protein
MFNRAAERSFRWTAREVIGRPLDILIPERFREAHRSHVRAFVDGAATTRRIGDRAAPIYGLRKDGTEFVAEAAISKIRIGDELTCTVVLRDVTRERHRSAQEQLLAEIGLLLTSSLDRKRLVRQAAERLVRGFADACVIDLVEDPETGLVVSRSVVVHRDPGKSETALALERVEVDRRRPHLASASLETRKVVLVSHVTPEYLDSISPPGEHRRLLHELAPVSLITIPLQARGLLLGLLTFVCSDPTRRYDESDVAFVEEIAQRLALATDNARLFETATNAITARDEMLRIVAHDLRNPLGAIVLRASLLQEDADDDERRESATAIATAAKRMNRLIGDLLDVTRSEAGHLSVNHASIPPDAVVREAAAAQRALAAKAALEFRTDVPEDLPDVRGDRDRLLQVFENLIGNAVKFTPAGGCIVVGAARHGREVLFRVQDTGEGIPAEDLSHVFDRFWQARKRRADGAGLGLAIVKALVEAHGGRVWVESTPGSGTTFSFTIPTSRAHRPGERDAPPRRAEEWRRRERS